MIRRSLLLSLAVVVWVSVARATIVTAPLASSQPLINPSAAAFRAPGGVFLAGQQTNDKTSALDLKDSTFDVGVSLKVYDLALFAALGALHFEINVSQQLGVKDTSSTVTSSTFDKSAKTTTNSLKLVPIQVIAAYKFNGWSLGLKRTMTLASYDGKEDFSLATADTLTEVDEAGDQNANFAVTGLGVTVNLFGSGFYVASDVDYLELDNKVSFDGQTSLTKDGNTTRSHVISADETRTSVVKTSYGLGYLKRAPGGDVRAEIDYETMPPLSTEAGLSRGELIRATAEATWGILHFGGEYVQRKGYYVDANNLVPYFFKFEHLSDEPVVEFGAFGGFRWSRGHGLGLSYWQSTKQKFERLATSDTTTYHIDRKTVSYGLSYSYVF